MKDSRTVLANKVTSHDRWMVCVNLRSSEVPLSEYLRANKRFGNAKDRINLDLTRLTESVSLAAGKPIRPARLIIHLGKSPEGHIADYLSEIAVELASDTRAFLSLRRVQDSKMSALTGISHLVQIEIEPDTHSHGWYAGGAVAHAVVRTSEEAWPLLVEDILLDICMSHCFPDSVAGLDDNVTGKVDFAKGLGIESYYGPIHQGLRYISLASFARHGSAFDPVGYVRLWREFLSSGPPLDSPGPSSGTSGSPERAGPTGSRYAGSIERKSGEAHSGLVSGILSEHVRGSQISRMMLSRLLAGLDPGAYFLVRAEKKPRRKRAVIELSFLFGKGKWKTGKMTTIEARDLKRYQQHHPYISLYRFEVPDTYGKESETSS